MASRCCTCAHMTFQCLHARMCACEDSRERLCVCMYWCVYMHMHVYLNAGECWCVCVCVVNMFAHICTSFFLSFFHQRFVGFFIDWPNGLCVIMCVCMHSRLCLWCVCTLLYWLASHSLRTLLTHTQADDEIVKMIKEYSVEFGEDPAGANLCFNSCSLSLCLSACIYVCRSGYCTRM